LADISYKSGDIAVFRTSTEAKNIRNANRIGTQERKGGGLPKRVVSVYSSTGIDLWKSITLSS
jgi:hypothetical protein